MQRGAGESWEDCACRGFSRPLPEPEVRRVVLSSDPSVDGGCTVMVLVAAEEAVFCKPTVASWRALAFAPGAFSAVDVTYQDGAFRLVSHYWLAAARGAGRRDALHALAHAWDGQCLVQRGGGELLMAAWSGDGRELAVFRLGSDGWWTEAGDVGQDVVFLASKDSGGLAFGAAWMARDPCLIRQEPGMFFDDKSEEFCVICSAKATET